MCIRDRVESLQSFWEYFQKQLDNDSFTEALIQHATYVVLVTISATVISVSLGVAVRHRPVAREVALGIASVFLTFPSLALFTLFIPILGLGFKPAFVALLLYACLLYTSPSPRDRTRSRMPSSA